MYSGGSKGAQQAPPLKLDQLWGGGGFSIFFFIKKLKNKAQNARESIKTTLELPWLFREIFQRQTSQKYPLSRENWKRHAAHYAFEWGSGGGGGGEGAGLKCCLKKENRKLEHGIKNRWKN